MKFQRNEAGEREGEMWEKREEAEGRLVLHLQRTGRSRKGDQHGCGMEWRHGRRAFRRDGGRWGGENGWMGALEVKALNAHDFEDKKKGNAAFDRACVTAMLVARGRFEEEGNGREMVP